MTIPFSFAVSPPRPVSGKAGAWHVAAGATSCFCSKNHPKNRGFTLVELMTVVVILGILMALAAPSFGDVMRRWSVSTATDALVQAMSLARTEAVRRGAPIGISPVAAAACRPAGATSARDWSCGLTVYVDTNKNGALDAGDVVLRELDEFKNITILREISGTGNGALIYTASGVPKTANGTALGRFFLVPRGDEQNAAPKAAKTLCMNWAGYTRAIQGKGSDALCAF